MTSVWCLVGQKNRMCFLTRIGREHMIWHWLPYLSKKPRSGQFGCVIFRWDEFLIFFLLFFIDYVSFQTHQNQLRHTKQAILYVYDLIWLIWLWHGVWHVCTMQIVKRAFVSVWLCCSFHRSFNFRAHARSFSPSFFLVSLARFSSSIRFWFGWTSHFCI